MYRALLPTSLIIFLVGCVSFTSPIPDGYQGPLATIKDSVKSHSSSKADFFYLTEVDGKRIEDSRIKTIQVNQGRGFYMQPVALERKIPARTSVLKIVGRTEYAAPILALTNTVYQVAGEVSFRPEADRTYVVKGELGETRSIVWIEDAESGAMVANKIEIKGSAALGTFEK